MKKILSVFLSVVMAMGACAINAFAAESYTRIENLNELQDGGKYLLVCRDAERDDEYYIMLPEVVEKDGRKGFDLLKTTDFGEDKKTVEGNYADELWTFTKSSDGWQIGYGGEYTLFTQLEGHITATLENEGSVFTIEKGEYNYTYNFISGENSFNRNKRGLFNGYKKEENPAPFYIYKSASTSSATETVGLVASLKYDETKTGVQFNVKDTVADLEGSYKVSYAELAETAIEDLAAITVGLMVTNVPDGSVLTATAELYE